MGIDHIENLKTACSNPDLGIIDLLKKAHLAAREAADKESKNWIENEMHGYNQKISVPEYRTVEGKLAAYDSFQGWQVLKSNTPEIKEEIKNIKIRESASELVAMVEKTREEKAYLSQELQEEKQKKLQKKLGLNVKFARVIEPEKAQKILQQLRNKIHMWAFNLDKNSTSQAFPQEIKINLEQLKNAPDKTIAQELEKIAAELKSSNTDYQKINTLFQEFLKKL